MGSLTKALAKVHNAAKGTLKYVDPIGGKATEKLVDKNTDKVRDATNWDATTGERHGSTEIGDHPAADAEAARVVAEGERLKVEAEATSNTNALLTTTARRRRAQKNLLSTSVLASGASQPSTVLGSGGAG